MTVHEFKLEVAGWPELDCNGEPATVWMMTSLTTSSEVDTVTTLNDADMLLRARQHERGE